MKNIISGNILINKPPGPTSHDIIVRLRKITGIKKIGHAGTLDPFAQGLLIVAIGRESTKTINIFMRLEKEYIAKIYLGATSNTLDKTGKIKIKKCQKPDKKIIEKKIKNFLGAQKQIPPMFSAKKVNGKKLYELARQGREIKREAQKINIYNIHIVSYEWPYLEIKVKCSSGTYIRSLSDDIGKSLNCGAYLDELTRTAIGKYKLSDSVSTDMLNSENWQSFLLNKL